MPLERVLIVGGGLAGPALALALARQNIRSSIFEIHPQRTIAASSISLAPNALRALDHIIGRCMTASSRSASLTVASRCTPTTAISLAISPNTTMTTTHCASYAPLHNTMLDACADQPDLIQVRYSARLTHIEDGEDGVIIRFEDGSSARGDILIGADGIHSKVREHVLSPMAPTPTFLGSCATGLDLPYAIFTPVGMVSVWPHNHDGSEVPDRAAWREYSMSGAAARAAKAHYASVLTEPIRSLMDNVKDDGVQLWVPHSMPDIPTWHRGRVCLIGDAAHALPPNGQGSAMAFEDAAYLSSLLSSEEALACGFERVFAQFERNRRARIDRVKRLGH
ncbi:hypothetical protein B0H12DRAFT_1274374, partial [Mycena haematopus]